MNHRLTALLGAVLLAAVVVAATAAGNSQPPKPTSLSDGGPPWRPAPATRVALDLVAQRDQGMWEAPVPVVNGKPLILPEDALLDGLLLKAHCPPPENIPQGLTCLRRPTYMIVRDGEVASVSAATGEFQIGMDHEDTFEFLINQLGRDKMQLVETGFYEKRWGPFRADYIREDR